MLMAEALLLLTQKTCVFLQANTSIISGAILSHENCPQQYHWSVVRQGFNMAIVISFLIKLTYIEKIVDYRCLSYTYIYMFTSKYYCNSNVTNITGHSHGCVPNYWSVCIIY